MFVISLLIALLIALTLGAVAGTLINEDREEFDDPHCLYYFLKSYKKEGRK